jgi:hypothetical protein
MCRFDRSDDGFQKLVELANSVSHRLNNWMLAIRPTT